MKKIGILGGTFNPPHLGHLNMALEAQKQYELDQVWFMPAGIPPHKEVSFDVSVIDRFKMTEAMIKGIDCLYCKDFEVKSVEKSYTYLTLKSLNDAYPDCRFYFIIGADSLDTFDSWVHPELISEYADILICDRNYIDESSLDKICSEKETKYKGRFLPVHMKDVPVSSSMIREASDISELRDYISPEVVSYIEEHELYTKTDISGWANLSDIKKDLKKRMKASRYRHTLGVMDTCASLAMKYSYPLNKALYAGLLHDCAKYMTDEELLKICKKNNIEISDSEREMPFLLHAKAGAYLAKEKYKVTDSKICHAIKVHTTGCPEMTLIDKILFVADYIEPNRFKQRNLTEIRNIAFYDLDLCVKMILRDTIYYLESTGLKMDMETKRTYDYYMNIKTDK